MSALTRSLRQHLLALLFAAGSAGCTGEDPEVASEFELSRFQGRWYELARIPRDHDRLCHDTVADYRLVTRDRVELVHQCRLASPNGAPSAFRASASSDDPSSPAKLTLHLGLYSGAYWVLEVGADYDYAVIGHPSRTMLWVLARTPALPADTYAGLLDRARAQGFPVESLVRTPQSAAPAP